MRTAALKAGKTIRYEGPGGPTSFDSYHDSTGIFQIDTYSASGKVNVAGNIVDRAAQGAGRMTGAGSAAGRRALFLASLGFGLVTASVLAIAAVGFTLQFGVTDVLNLAFGAVMIAGAFIAYLLNHAGVSVWAGLLVAMVVCSLGSVALNTLVYTPFQRRGATPITMVIVSLGMTLIIEFGVQARGRRHQRVLHAWARARRCRPAADPDHRAARRSSRSAWW